MENENASKSSFNSLSPGSTFSLHYDAKSDAIKLEWRSNSVTRAGPTLSGVAIPCATTNYFDVVAPCPFPASPVIRGQSIAVVPGVNTPFPDVSMHVIQAERIRYSHTANRNRLLARGAFRG